VGELEDARVRAAANTATRLVPKSAGARMCFLLRAERGSTRAVAARLGVTRCIVERYVKGALRHPGPELAARLEREVRRSWQPRLRQRARRQAATATGMVIEARARFGFTAAPGSTDDSRLCRITQHLPPSYASRLLEAQSGGATGQQLRAIAAEGLQEVYFKGCGAQDLEVEFTDIDYVEVEF
jgi:hypothetical protein